jgi:hypothetical protein
MRLIESNREVRRELVQWQCGADMCPEAEVK